MTKQISELSEKIYRTIYQGCKKDFDTFDVYLDRETGDVRAITSGVQYPGEKIFEMITGFNDFVDSDDLTENEFVEACYEAHGEPEIN